MNDKLALLDAAIAQLQALRAQLAAQPSPPAEEADPLTAEVSKIKFDYADRIMRLQDRELLRYDDVAKLVGRAPRTVQGWCNEPNPKIAVAAKFQDQQYFDIIDVAAYRLKATKIIEQE